jgi:hypothetical protein
MRRTRFQQGSLPMVKRAAGRKAWEYRRYGKHLGHSEGLWASNHANQARRAEPSCELPDTKTTISEFRNETNLILMESSVIPSGR